MRIVLLTLLAVVLSDRPASAHKILLEARLDGDKLRVEVAFDDDTPAQGARIVIENERNEIVAEGKADERGIWSTPKPVPGSYRIKADSVGHATSRDLLIGDAPKAEGETPQRRKHETGKPWLKAVIGIGAIAVVFAVVWFLRRGRQQLPDEPAGSP